MRRSFVFALGLASLGSAGCFSEPGDAVTGATGSSGAPTGPAATDPGDADTGESMPETTAETLEGTSGGESTGIGETLLGSSTGWGTTGSTGGLDGSSAGSSEESGEESGDDAGTGSASSCGDGVREGDEVCDDGPRPALEAGACRPTCDGIIPTREVRLSAMTTAGDLTPNPVATLDALCPAGYRALFAHGGIRRATVSGNEVDDPIDWVLHPFTAYVNESGAPVWVTDDTPLLGVRGGLSQTLDGPIVPYEDNPLSALTGMNNDWTTTDGSDDDCVGWTSSDIADLHTGGVPWIVDGGAFLNNGGFMGCNHPTRAYCVQQ